MASKALAIPGTKAMLLRADDGFDLPRLGVEDGTLFGYEDRWNMSMTPDGKYVTDLADWAARDMHEMLTKDYKGKQIENVLTLPLTSAEHSIVAVKGDKGEADWLRSYWETDAFSGGCRTSLEQIIALCTSAFYFKRAYFEKVWRKGTGDFVGKIVYDDLAWRPQTTCRLMRDPQNGRFKGFEQQPYFVGPNIRTLSHWPIQIPPNRAFVYTHGTRRDPLNGTSDMEVAFWAWKTKQKVLLLWFQFLQSVALPRITVKAGTTEEARAVAAEIAKMKSSGVLPIGAQAGPDSVAIDALDTSGKGADQFKAAIDWLDGCATQSVLAGFLDLVAHTTTAGAGSYALSKDASDFFLQSLEAKAREIENQIRQQLFAPLIFHNFGPGAAVPKLAFEPLNDIDKDASLELLKSAMAAPPGGPVPTSFISELAGQVANYLGLDGDQAREDFKKSFDAAAAQAQAKMLADNGAAGGGTPTGQAVAGFAGAVGAAHKAIQAGVNPATAHKQARQAVGADAKVGTVQAKQSVERTNLLVKHAKNATAAKTGGDVTLSVEDTDLAGFNPAEPRVAGKWAPAQGGTKTGQKQKKVTHAHLLVEKAQLEAEAKHLREQLARLHPGTHAGAAGVHRGQAGAHKGPKNAGPTKGATGSKTAAPGASGGGPQNLAAQVAHLKKVVAHLISEVEAVQEHKARKKH